MAMIRHSSFSTKQRGGFTLIELLVVLAIAAVISAVTLGGFKEMREGNKRVACNTNLSQLYQAARLYAADEGGNFPAYRDDCAGNKEGIGLWALYTFPEGRATAAEFSTIAPVGNKPIERYMRSSKVLHCPADQTNDQLYLDPETKAAYNPAFLSYQACDGTTPTYATVRTTTTTDMEMWKRQLIHFDGASFVKRKPEGSTIVTYCMHHRGERGMDNVLFYDGSIQLLKQNEGGLTGWQRKPKDPQ